jgi:hypothetical protein
MQYSTLNSYLISFNNVTDTNFAPYLVYNGIAKHVSISALKGSAMI